MSSQACDGCGERVRVAGGIANLWTLEPGPTGGVTLELEGGDEHFLCFSCLEALPDDATSADVAALD